MVSSVATVGAGPFSAGQMIQVDQTIRNSGTVDAGAFRVGIYLSDDATIDTTDTLLGTRTLSGLVAGATDGATTSVQIPAGQAPGNWRIGAFVDDLGAVM